MLWSLALPCLSLLCFYIALNLASVVLSCSALVLATDKREHLAFVAAPEVDIGKFPRLALLCAIRLTLAFRQHVSWMLLSWLSGSLDERRGLSADGHLLLSTQRVRGTHRRV